MNNEKIAEFLKSLRKAKGYTQQQVADLLFISPKTVSKWESGEGIPDISIISAVAEVYDVSVDDILKGEKSNLENQKDQQRNKVQSTIIKKIISKLQNFIYAGIGVNILGIIIGIILAFTVDPLVGFLIIFLFVLISITIVVIGYGKYKNSVLYEEDDYIIEAFKQTTYQAKNSLYWYAFTTVILFLLSIYLPIGFSVSSSNFMTVSFLNLFLFLFPFIGIKKSIRETNQIKKRHIKSTMYLTLFGYTTFLLVGWGFFSEGSIADTWFQQTSIYVFRMINLIMLVLFIGHVILISRIKRAHWTIIFTAAIAVLSSALVYFDYEMMDYGSWTYGIMPTFNTLVWLVLLIIFYIRLLANNKTKVYLLQQ